MAKKPTEDTGANTRAGFVESWNRPWLGREPRNLFTRHHHNLDHLDLRHDLSKHPDHERTAIIRRTIRTTHSMVREVHASLDQTSIGHGSRLSPLSSQR